MHAMFHGIIFMSNTFRTFGVIIGAKNLSLFTIKIEIIIIKLRIQSRKIEELSWK